MTTFNSNHQNAKTTEAAELLLDWDANANLRNLQGDTPLHLASRKNNVKLINLLLQKVSHVHVLS